jgi:hypothetical protein
VIARNNSGGIRLILVAGIVAALFCSAGIAGERVLVINNQT